MPKLLNQVRLTLRARHYSIRTEQAYVSWIRDFILFHEKRHPRELDATSVPGFHTSQQIVNVQTTQICTYVLNKGGQGVKSPLDQE